MPQKKVPHPAGAVRGEPVAGVGVNHHFKWGLLLMESVHQSERIGDMNVVINGPMDQQHGPDGLTRNVLEA